MVGLPYMIGGKNFPAEPPAGQSEVEAHIKKLNVTDLVIVGYVIPMIVLWLMVFKPFYTALGHKLRFFRMWKAQFVTVCIIIKGKSTWQKKRNKK